MSRKRPLSKDDVDFGWAKKEPAHVLAMAAWYEYARESKPLIERVNALRQAKMFTSDDEADLGIIKEHCSQHLGIISLLQIYVLVCSDTFPSNPFNQINREGDLRLALRNELFGTDGPVALPWTTFFALKKGAMIDSSAVYAKWHLRGGRSIRPISIPWDYTNAELIEMFRPIIKRLRPKEFPEPPRAGRKGRMKSRGGLELLQQLVAYRLTKHGITFDDPPWRSFHIYTSKRGFENAARAAANRISMIIKVPFFRRNASAAQSRK